MRNLMLIILLLSLAVLWADLPTCYYTYDQISQLLTDYENQYPDIAKKHLIGYSQEDELPIYALRISDNVDTDEDEPALLFVGQVHAEEVLGVQITMSNIAEILNSQYQFPYMQWINQLDMWFVPTLNPEGHNVVTSNLDTSYRKNKRDNNQNGIFDYSDQVGYDIDGVDINRNFEFNWTHGDTLMQPGGLEVYDYYRGPGELSESETRAIKSLTDQYPFVYSICWHSSRTGNFSEKAYYSFNWKEVRPSPDRAFAQSICDGVAAQITNEAGTANYESLPNLSRKGCFHDWMYQQYGTFQLLIECGTSNLQPDSLLMVDTIQRCTNGVRWLLNRALPYSDNVPTSSMLTGQTLDSSNQQAIQAEVIIQERHAPWFRPRMSQPETGRFYKPLSTGSYTVQARKKGYWDTILYDVMVYGGAWTQIQLGLAPRDPAVLSGHVRSGNQEVSARMIIGDVFPDTLYVNGDFVYNGYEGEFPVEVYADGYFPWKGTINLFPGQNSMNFELSPVDILFSEDWESGTDGWDIEGPWALQNELSSSGYALTDSWGGWGFYAMNADVWIKLQSPIQIPENGSAVLLFDSHLYTEHMYDPVYVEASTDGQEWIALWEKSGRHDHFQMEQVSLDDYAGSSIYLRLRLTDESIHIELTDPGWTIDNIRIITGTSSVENDDGVSPAIQAALYPNYPNPFNPETTIRFSLAKPTDIDITIYNARGQLVRKLIGESVPSGDHQVVWNGRDDGGNEVGSGIYLYRMQSGDYVKTRKMMLVK
ncbi:MAG: M14 family zinc carboxypeptidase [Candidatus Syntrophosphaera sp.]